MRGKEKHLLTIAFQSVTCRKNKRTRNLLGKPSSNNYFRPGPSVDSKMNGQKYDEKVCLYSLKVSSPQKSLFIPKGKILTSLGRNLADTALTK